MRQILLSLVMLITFVTMGAKQNITIGTIGPLDHGKTTLTAAITRELAKNGLAEYHSFDMLDDSPEEMERGITIDIDAIEYDTPNRHYFHIDCPGHHDYLNKTDEALSKMDGAIVVVSATDGFIPEIREHIRMARIHNVPALIVFINKCDMVDDQDVIDSLEKNMRLTLTSYGFDGINTPIIKGSALGALNGIPEWEEGVKDLINALDSWIPKYINSKGGE